MTTTTTTSQQQDPGVAGRTNYRKWDKVASDLVEDVEAQEQQEQAEASSKMGLDGKYARSHAEAEERTKAQQAHQTKKTLQKYQERENQVMQTFSGLLEKSAPHNSKSIVRITRDILDAGKRVIAISDTRGSSERDNMIVLTQDLSLLESKMAANTTTTPKSYTSDAENSITEEKQHDTRRVYGLIKVFLSNIHDCTVVIRCKLISGTVEMSHCSNVILKVEQEACVATLQTDLSQDITIQFHDAPSGKSTGLPGHAKLYWGEDVNDRIFTAGVSNMKLQLWRDGFIDQETTVDYLKDGATAVGNASAEEMQFVTSVVDGELKTERVVRHGGSTSKSSRAMTQRELDEEKDKRDKAVDMVMEKAIRFEEKGEAKKVDPVDTKEEEIEEVYTSMSKSEIKEIISECEGIKVRGNEAFAAGEYAQAVLFYSLALDKADELPDKETGATQLFARHIILANRSAAFLKLGEHEKALTDATRAQEIDPTYVKGVFRKGLALHALGRYLEAIKVLVQAHKLEPHSKQIKQALQFSEMRMQQEMQQRSR